MISLAIPMLVTAFCPTVAEVSETVGLPVRVVTAGTRTYGPAEMCAYQATSSPGVTISVSVQPVSPDEDPIGEVRAAARTFAGADAERIDVGDGGYAYSSKTKSEAAARKGDRVYHAEIQGLADKMAAAVGLLKRVVK